MPDTNNENNNETDNANKPPLPPPQNPPLPPDTAQYVRLARPQAHAVFTEQRVEFKGDDVKQVVAKREPGDDASKIILAKTAKELLDAGRIAYCTKLGKLIDAEKTAKDDK